MRRGELVLLLQVVSIYSSPVPRHLLVAAHVEGRGWQG